MEPHEIKAFRKARSQSQTALGADLGVDRKTIQRWEHGDTRPPGRLLELACRQLKREREFWDQKADIMMAGKTQIEMLQEHWASQIREQAKK